MLKFSNMPAVICYSKCLRLLIKNKSKSSQSVKEIKRRMREQKLMFGPLLETRKQKNELKSQLSNKRVTSSEIVDRNDRKLEDFNENPELLWTVKKAARDNLKIIKVGKKENEKNKTYNFDKSDSATASKNKLKLNSSADSLSGSTNSEVKSNNLQVYDPIKFPLFDTQKDNDDNWETSEIVTQPLIESKSYSLPGVTKILSETMSDEAKLLLEKWKKNMIAKLGAEGFEKYSNALLEDSKILHSLIGDTLKKEKVDVPDHLKPTYNSIKLILKDITDVRLVESHVVHPTLGYRGIVDCVASYRGNLCLIDWKKSEKIKTLNTIYDSPLQLSAYIGALNSDPNYPFKVKTGLLAIAYVEGQPPSVFKFTAKKLEVYWQEWLKRVEKYNSIMNARRLFSKDCIPGYSLR